MASNHSNSDSLRSYPSATLSDLEEIRKVFARFDTNGDGKISSSELSGVLSALGSHSSPDELSRMMEEMDADRDGFVSLSEFAEFCAKKVEGDESGAKELKDAFDMYDEDRNGLISAEELHKVLSRLGERCSVEDCSRMILSVDSDGDGNVNFDEFRRMMTNGKKSS